MQFRGKYGFLSNFYSCSVILDGVTYPSVENAYQAAKTVSKHDRERIRQCSPSAAKQLGRRVKMRPDFNRLAVMESLLRSKFSNPALAAQLKAVKGEIVEENTWGDRFWGVCGTGQNHLGRLLMAIRDSL